MAAPVGSRNARKSKWKIMRDYTDDGRMIFCVIDGLVDRKTTSLEFNSFEDAQIALQDLREEERKQ